MMDIEDITEVLAINLIGVVPEDEIIVVSTNRGEPAVTEYTSRAGEAYRRVARRLLGKKCRLWLWNIMKESSINSEKCWEWQPGKEEQDMAIWDLSASCWGGIVQQSSKERLRLVLVHDRSNTATVDVLNELKEDLIKVISEYMEIDENALEVSFSNSDNSVALVANIPVIGMRRAVGSKRGSARNYLTFCLDTGTP